MPNYFTDIASVICGCVRRPDMGYLVYQTDAESVAGTTNTFFIQYHQGQLKAMDDYTWLPAGLAVATKPVEQAIFVGRGGEVYGIGSGKEQLEQIGTDKEGPKTRGALRCAKEIDGKVYAAGMDRQVYRRDDANKWVVCDKGARPQKGSKAVVGFEGIDGFSEKEIYAVGWDGEIWQSDGKEWNQIDSPTNILLTAMCCAGDGNVYACGRQGLLVRGRGDKWEVLSAFTGYPFDFWGICWFDGKLYLSGTQNVFTYDKKFEIVKMGQEKVDSCYKLSTRDGVMWSIGAKDVMAFDGKVWTRIE